MEMRRYCVIAWMLVLGGVVGGAAESPREGPRLLAAREHRVGELIGDVPFTDLDGKPGRLSDFRGKPLVVCMTSVTCPLARRYAPVLADLERKYRDQGVA